MATIQVFLLVGLVAAGSCQMFGGGGMFGYRAPVYSGANSNANVWGSVQPKPLNLGLGANWDHNRGHGASISGQHMPGLGSQATLGGKLGLVHTPNHQLSAMGSHTKTFDNHFKQVGAGSNTAGLGYKYTGNEGRTSVGVNAETKFGHGMKPSHQVGLEVAHNFK